MNGLNFNKAELLKFAITGEENGVKFYTELSKRVNDELKKIFLGFANDEKSHAELFQNWYDQVKDSDMDDYIFEPEVDGLFKELSRKMFFESMEEDIPETLLQALDSAIKTEQRTIDYYTDLLKYASTETRPILEKFIKEECGHRDRMKELKKTI